MNLKSLRIFILVIEERTLEQASAKLNLSQPAASRLLRLLEEELNIALFFRHKQRLVATPEGELFYPEAVRILASLDDLPTFFKRIQSNAIVPLRIICHPRIVDGLVLPAMTKLCKRNPELRTKLEVYPRRDLGRRIIHDLYDIGVCTLPLPVENLKPTLLCSRALHVIVAREHRLAKRRRLRPIDLVNEAYIALDQHTVIRQIVNQNLMQAGYQLEPKYETSTGASAYRLVCSGLGFTFADPIAIDADLKKKLAFIPWQPAETIDFGYFLPDTARRHKAINQFIECLEDVCSAG